MRRTWKLHRDRNWKRKQRRLHGMCTSVLLHPLPWTGEARTDLGLKTIPSWNQMMVVQLWLILFTDASARVVLTDSGLEPPLARLHPPSTPPPPSSNSAPQKQQQFVQLKGALTCSTAEQSQAECVTEHFWVFSAPACCGVFGQEHYLLNLISCFLTGSNSNSGYKTAAAATVPTGFFSSFSPTL